MNAYKVTASHAFDRWRDFTFVYAQSKQQALLQALNEFDLPELANDKIIITVSQESSWSKNKRSRR